MAYITIANSKKLVQKLDEVALDGISEKIYKKDIYFFNRRESANLKGIRELFRNPENIAFKYYSPIIIQDTFRYLFPESQPAYHADNTCEKLTSRFINKEIPPPIRLKGKEEVIKFRNWYNTKGKHITESEKFIYSLQIYFPYIGEMSPKSIDLSNSGTEEKENFSLTELENKIDNLLREAGRYYRENPEKQLLIKRYQKWTFLAYVYEDIYKNESGLSSNDLKEFLLFYETTFKTPVKNLLVEYYRVLFNPSLTFDGNILDKLGFNPCKRCIISPTKTPIEHDINDCEDIVVF